MKFGVHSPNALAGMMYPVPFASAEDVVDIAVEAEQLGYDNVAANDHISTRQYVRDAWPAPPDYFELLVTLSNIAARTSVLRLMTAILLLPMRQPVLAAKQIATLDNLSGGRLIVGAGEGHRDEFEEVCPDMKDQPRAELTDEGIRALRVLFEDARAAGREPARITTALTLVVCLGDTPEQPREILENSAFGPFGASLNKTTTKGVDMDRVIGVNLVGTPGQVCEKVAAFEAAGVEHLCSQEFAGNTVEEMTGQIRRFARDVIPAFPDKA